MQEFPFNKIENVCRMAGILCQPRHINGMHIPGALLCPFDG